MIKTKKEAKRLAKTIVSDICVYHKEVVEEGIRNDNIFEVLEPQINEGKSYYEGQVDPKLVKENNFFNEALVDVLLSENNNVKSKIW